MLRAIAVALLLAAAASASAQGLGAAAEKERQRRARGSGPPPKVITAEELAQCDGRIANDPEVAPAVPVAAPAETAAGALPSEPTVVLAEDDREAYWRGEAGRRRARLDLAEKRMAQVARWSDPTYAGPDRPT